MTRLSSSAAARCASSCGSGQRSAAGPRLLRPGQTGPDARGRQVLRLAVVLVPAGELARLGHVEVADGAYPRGKVHAGDAIRASCPGFPGRNGPA